jgi:MFS transporter
VSTRPPSTAARVREIFARSGFRRFFAARAASQLGDGIFQLAAADLLLFKNPGANPAMKLLGISIVTLIPFSLLSPFVGVFIDRWERRKILTRTPALRALVALAVPLVAPDGKGAVFYGLVLIVLSANRFFLATMSAVLPQLVGEDDLIVANSVSSTGGSITHAIGLGIGAAASSVFGGTRAVFIGAVGFAVAAALARRLEVHRGFQPEKGPLLEELREVVAELVDGLRRITASARASYALGAVVAGQLLVGAMSGALVVYFLSVLGLKIGSATSVLGAIATGLAVGVVLVPALARRFAHDLLIPPSFAIGGIAVVLTGAFLSRSSVVVGAAVVGFVYAMTKIPVETILQEELPDAYRGRGFAVHDMLFNTSRVAGTAAAAFAVDAHVTSGALIGGVGGGYVLASAAFWLIARRLVPVRFSGFKLFRRSRSSPAALLPVGEMVGVRAYAGGRADEEPRAVVVGGREVPISSVDWRAVEERDGERRRIFVVRVGGLRVRLAHRESASMWEVERILPAPRGSSD